MTAAALLSARGGGPFARRDPRALVLTAVLFALITVSLRSVSTALVALVLSGLMVALARLSWRDVLGRLLILEGVMIVLLLTLPFMAPGQSLFTAGPLTATDAGVALAALIVCKAHAVALAVLGLLGRMEPAALGHALAGLGLPERLAQLLLLTLRQIALLHQELLRLRQAMRARCFVARSDRHTWTSFGQLIGMLLVRSLDRARRIEEAMRCRGFRGRFHRLNTQCWRWPDTLWLLGALVILTALLVLDRLS